MMNEDIMNNNIEDIKEVEPKVIFEPELETEFEAEMKTSTPPVPPLAEKTGSMNAMEQRLREQLLAEQAIIEEKEELDPEEEALLLRKRELEGFSLIREYARPVEQILRLRSVSKPNWYKLLDVSSHSTTEEIVSSYKEIAQLVHPDINPHPLAKKAFDVLTESVTLLSNLPNRTSFDQALAERKNPIFITKKILKMVIYWTINTKAKCLLTYHRLRDGEWEIELEE